MGVGEQVGVDGVLVPGGFGSRGWEGKILACRIARDGNVTRIMPLSRKRFDSGEEDHEDVLEDSKATDRVRGMEREDLRAILLGTGDALLVEHTSNDSYWGDGGDGSGQNRLGRLLSNRTVTLLSLGSAGRASIVHARHVVMATGALA